jgi:iron(III) transport system ATP-binding protein
MPSTPFAPTPEPAAGPPSAVNGPPSAVSRPPFSPAVELHCVVKHFIHGDQADVKGLSLIVQQGEILVLLGPSGCGKTTTLRLIAGFEQPDGGTVRVAGQLMADRQRSVPPEKRGLGMVFQDYALFPHLTVAENAAFGLHHLPRRQRKLRVDEVLQMVGLAELADRPPHTLSGGQQQRVALARALAPRPSVILFDEPFSNLDAELRQQMRQEVRRILKDSANTAVFVTHDQQEALLLGDRVAVMRRGYVEQVDTPDSIYHTPQTRFVADFLGAADFLPGRTAAEGVQTEIGTLPPAAALRAGRDVDVMVRPHDLRAEPSATGHGVIGGAEFVGDSWQYTVRLTSGGSVRCLMPHTAVYPLGTPVAVTLDADHGLACFHGETSVSR